MADFLTKWILILGVMIIIIQFTMLYFLSGRKSWDTSKDAIKPASIVMLSTSTIAVLLPTEVGEFLLEPDNIPYFILVLMVLSIIGFSNVFNLPFKREEPIAYSAKLVNSRSCLQPCRDSNIKAVAYHEGAHALIYGLLENQPKDTRLTIVPSDNYRGMVTSSSVSEYMDSTTNILSLRNCEWNMLLRLAGHIGEAMLLKEETTGSKKDMKEWLEYANQYLINKNDTIYFTNPESALELDYNTKLLLALKSQQVEIVETFLESNKKLLIELSETIMEKHILDYNDLEPFWNQIKFQESGMLKKGYFYKK